jgi:hypothetical protein
LVTSALRMARIFRARRNQTPPATEWLVVDAIGATHRQDASR